MPIVNREKLEYYSYIYFTNRGETDFGEIPMGDWANGLEEIQEKDNIVIRETNINIHISIPGKYFVQKCYSDNGFTFRKLVKKIVHVGLAAMRYNIFNNPHHYTIENPRPEDILNLYQIWSYKNSSSITKKGNNIYVSFE